jgi:hypothetical protein
MKNPAVSVKVLADLNTENRANRPQHDLGYAEHIQICRGDKVFQIYLSFLDISIPFFPSEKNLHSPHAVDTIIKERCLWQIIF